MGRRQTLYIVSNSISKYGRGEDNILTKKEIGKRGEEIAAEFLQRKGFSVVERNYHSRWGELDLIAVKSDEAGLVNDMYFDDETEEMKGDATLLQGNSVRFVEVKTRTGTTYGTPSEAVNYVKQQKIRKTALVWLQEQEQYYSDLCFDVIEVWVVGKTAKIRWLKSCF